MTRRYAIVFLTVMLPVLLAGCGGRQMEPNAQSEPPVLKAEEFPASEKADMEDAPAGQPQGAQEPEKPAEESVELEKADLVAQILPADGEFVKVADYIPTIVIDLKYATEDNFTGAVIYSFSEAYLRYGTVRKLQKVQEELEEQGLGLKIWDAFRPVSAQFRLWEICPDAAYVANPNNGFSSHSRGGTVDVTLVDSRGDEVEMPTGFDDFTAMADRDYEDCTEAARAHAELLENLMSSYDFHPYQKEWWHFTDSAQYEVDTQFDPGAAEQPETT